MWGYCGKVLDYRWKLGRKSIGSVWAFLRYICYLVAEMLKAGFVVMRPSFHR